MVMKNVKNFFSKGLVVLLPSLLISCASYVDHTREMREQVYSGKYGAALEKLEASEVKSSSNELLYYLEKATLLNRLGKLDESRKLLFKADKLVDKLYTESISKEVATFLVNDSVRDYPGEDYEKVAIHTQLAFSFIEEGKFKEARVEAKKINSRLYEIQQKYGDDYSAYKVDGFALFLSGLIFEKLGELDSAIIDYRKALKTYEKGFLAGNAVPESLVKSLYVAALRRGRSNVVSEVKESYPELVKGLSKESTGFVYIAQGFPVIPKFSQSFVLSGRSGLLRYSWPIIPKVYVPSPYFDLEVNGRSEEFELAQDLNKIARETLESNRTRMTVKNVARLVAKARAAQEVENRMGPLAGLIANIFNAATETADTRSWSLLPGRIYIGRSFLDPGKYKVTSRSPSGKDSSDEALRKGEMKFFILKEGVKKPEEEKKEKKSFDQIKRASL